MSHYYNLEEKRFIILKQILLALMLFISLVNFVFMISSIFIHNWFNLVYVILVWLLLLIVRIPTTFLSYSFEYKFNDNQLVIIKHYPMHDCKPIVINYADIEFVDNNENKVICLCPKSCDFNKYVIKYQNSAYLIALDEFGYCILNRRTNDIFR